MNEAEALDRRSFKGKAGQRFSAGQREYVLRGKIGDGAAGLVRKAIDKKTGELVAVKFLAPDWNYLEHDTVSDIRARFRREGARGRKLRHDNLVRILAYEENNNGEAFGNAGPVNPFLVMEFVQGRTLESLIKEIRTLGGDDVFLPYFVIHQTVHIAHRLCVALTHLHKRALIHRDVKPANIFLSPCRPGEVPSTVKLGDFGVLKWGDYSANVATGTLTMTNQGGLGTTKYMAPEQAMSPKTVSVRADMWSFGITLFELFTGEILASPQHVFGVSLARQRSHRTLTQKLMDVGVTIPDNHDSLWEAILNAFSFAASGRPSSKELEGRLKYVLSTLSSE